MTDRFVTEVMMGEIQNNAQVMRSISAELTESTWTFHAKYFQAGAGEYLIISKHEWDRIKAKFSPERATES